MIRKRAAALFLSVALLGGVFTVAASGGTASDPLISKGYADGTYTTKAVAKAEDQIAGRHNTIYAAAESKLQAQVNAYSAKFGGAAGGGYYNASFMDMRLKKGDVIQVSAGSGFLLLAGTAVVSYPTGAVIDVSTGAAQGAGVITVGKRYLAAENTVASVTVASPTAVLSVEGYYKEALSAETDYNTLALALKTLGLFKGSDTAYGFGYDLEQPPTRIQGLIMFLRLMGEEKAALATTEKNPFQDVPEWCRPYVAYAYEKGYTKGVDDKAMLFGTNSAMRAADYMTFVLRALGYRDSGEAPDFSWSSVLANAVGLGVLTPGEQKLLTEQTFLRAHVAYISYFALDVSDQGSGNTLVQRLVSDGTLDQVVVDTVRSGVTVKRIL